MPNINLSILNQKATPSFYADILANRPAPSFVGRVFISTDTYDLYRDTGSAWVLLSPSSTGTITGGGSLYRVGIWTSTSNLGESNDLIFDYSQGHLGINTNTPGTALDVHHDQPTIAILNQTNATNDARLGFQNNGVGLWRIGNFYNAGENDFAVYDAVNSLERLSVKNTGQTFIGAQTTSSGKLVVNQTASDNGIVVLGTTAPSIRVRTAGIGATQQFGLGLSTGVNNFIQGSASGDFCIFNGSSTASPITFGIYDAVALNNQEAARISASRNFLIGTTTDAGQKLQVNGTSKITASDSQLTLSHSGGVYSTTLVTNSIGNFYVQPNGSFNALTIANTGAATFSSTITATSGVLKNNSSTPTYLDFDGTNRPSGRNYELGTGYSGAGNDKFYIYDNTASATRLVIDASGNVGIGTTDPQTILNAFSSSAKGMAISNNYPFIGLNDTDGGNFYLGTQANIGYLWNAGTDALIIATNNAEKMRVSSTGNLLIGTTTDNGTKLQVNGTSTFSDTIYAPEQNIYLSYQTSAIRSVASAGTQILTLDMKSIFANFNFSSNYTSLIVNTMVGASSIIINIWLSAGATGSYSIVSTTGSTTITNVTFSGTASNPIISITASAVVYWKATLIANAT